jgi:arginyl-tRNA synthetase
VAALGLKTVKEQLEKGVYELSDGAVIFNGDKFGLHTRVFINKEGVPTYEAKDVGLIFTKDQDYHFDKSVVITGSEQLEYMKVVLKSVEQFAPELVEKTSHLTHGLVKLPGGVKMSSRKGNFLKAVDVLNMVKDELKNEYNSEDEKVSLAATKYAFLKYKMGGNIIFDPKESVKMTGNSGPYLLYSCVRAKKILANCNSSEAKEYAYNKHEKNLIKKILEYKGILSEAVADMAPHKVANFLYELAQEFSRFYENCPVAGAPEEKERAKLVGKYLEIMTHGLNILGIEIPEEM